MLQTPVCFVTVGLILFSKVIQGQVVNFDVPGGIGGQNYSGAGAAPDSGIYWNPIVYQGTKSGTLASDGGTASSITLTDSSIIDYNPGQGSPGTVAALEAPFVYENNGSIITENINNVPAGTYDLYLFGKNSDDSGNGNRGTTFMVSIGGTTYGTQSTVNSITTTFTQGDDYVEFTNLIMPESGIITFSYTANTAATGSFNPQNEGDFNGLQLVDVSPEASVSPTIVNAFVGTSTQLVATVYGAPPFSFQWQKGTNGVYVNSIDEGDISGSLTNILSFSGMTASDAADYRLIVANEYGSITSQVITVTVTLSPNILIQPTSTTTTFGDSFQLTASAIGQAPLSYQWQVDDNALFVDITNTSSISGTMTNVLSFTLANLSDMSDYQLVVTNAYGAVTSQVATVNVLFTAPVGASTPFTEYEAEGGTLAGGASIVSLVLPLSNTNNSTAVLEASGAAYVTLTGTGQSVSWVNKSGQNVTALNLRAEIPDAPTGYGTTNTLDLYVNGTFRQAITLNSAQTYVYGANPTDKNPADGGAFILWDEFHCFVTGSAIAPGSTITLQKDTTNTASFYNIDLIDLENPSAALSQPGNSLSITSYGAVSNNPSLDNTTAIQNCINAAQSSGQIAWIPQGTFYFGGSNHSGLSAIGATIEGAGMWYSRLYNNPVTPGQGGPFFNNLVSCTLQNLDLDGNAIDANSPGAMDVSGSNWVVNSVWVSHLGVGFWGAGNNGTIENMRVNNTWGDGINVNNFTGVSRTGSNITISNNFIRFVDNDGIAVNGTDSTGHTPMSGLNITHNTIDEAAGRLVVYGGNNIVISNNYCHDLVQNDGIQVGYFQQTGTVTNVLVENNLIVRCGDSTYQSPGLLIGTQYTNFVNNGTNEDYVDANVTAVGNIVCDPYYGGIQIQTCNNVYVENNVISVPYLYGVQVASFANGNAMVNNNVVSSLLPGQPMIFNGSPAFSVATTNNPVRPPIEAASYNDLSSSRAYRETCIEGGEDLCSLNNGDYAVYSNLDLNSINTFAARVATVAVGGNIEIHMDSPSGTLIGECAVADTYGAQTWDTASCVIGDASGYHNVYLVFTGGSGDLFSLEWFALLGSFGGIEAASYNNGQGILTENCTEGGLDLTNITSGAFTAYNQYNLTGAAAFNARVASGGSGGTIQILLDATNGTLVGTCTVPATGGWQSWSTASCTLNNAAAGYHNVYFVFSGGSGDLFNLESFQFQFDSTNGIPSDLALDQPVTASSVDGPYPAANAVDGNLNTRWSSAYSDPQWIYVDLGAVYNISAVTLVWEAASAKAYQIQVSTNATTWTTIYGETNGMGETENITGLSGSGRYVRLYGMQRNPVNGVYYGYSLWEFEVFGSAAQPAGATPAIPLLSITPELGSSQGLTLQWPDNGNRDLLSQPTVYYTPDLTPPEIWTAISNEPTYLSGQWILMAAATNNQGFYQLQQ